MTMLRKLKACVSHSCREHCEGCPYGGPKVGSKGNPEAPLVFVAESPGRVEVRIGSPLVGPTGKVFHQFVPDDDEIYVLNALECNPARTIKNEARNNVAAVCCNERLIEKVSAYPHRLIVAMGNPAVRSLTGDYSLKITQIRGKLIPSPYATLGIMPIVHIAALMQGSGSFRQWKEDVAYAQELGSGDSPREHIKANVQIVPEDASQEYVDFIFRQLTWHTNELTGDIETSGLNFLRDRILSIGVTPANDTSISYCFWPCHLPLIKVYLENRDISWCWHSGKFDTAFLQMAGIEARVDDDTMLMSYCLDETGGVHDLEQVSRDVLGAPDYKYMIKPWLPNKNTSYEEIPPNVLAEYQAIDTSNTAQIRSIYRKRIKADPDLEKLYTKTLLPANQLLVQIEKNGFYVDQERLDENDVHFAGILSKIGGEINELCGRSVNAGSPKQMSVVLFKQFKFPNRNKGSTDKGVLAKLKEHNDHPIIDLLLEHRHAVKMHGTSVKGVRNRLHADGRIHSTFQLHRARTGRIASKDPNMQNQPRLPLIRGQFIASPGYELLEIDLSQAELRSLACLSGDPVLCELYIGDGDIHTDLSIQLFPGYEERSLSNDEADYLQNKEERVRTKNVNFGIIYGITEYGLADQIGCSKQVAKKYLYGWYKRYEVAGEFIKKCRDTVLGNQVITTCFGRKKRIGIVSHKNLQFLQNEAANFPHQSIASDITLHTAMRVYKQLEKWGVRIVNLVHDSIVMEVPLGKKALKHKVIRLVRKEFMQVPIDWGLTRVPFKVDVESGQRWGSLRKYEEAA